MQLSQRLIGLNGDEGDGWGVFYAARQMVARGEDVTELTIGEHDIRTAAPILQEMHKAALGGHTGYAAITGTRALREAVAERTKRLTGVATGPENVLITPGGQAALFAAHMGVCDVGDVALYLDPYYATYPGTLRASGAQARRIQTDPAHGFHPQEEALEVAAKGARSLLINSPNNPTGAVYGPETLEAIARVCRRHDLWLISDEVYDSQVWSGPHLSPRGLEGMHDRTLVVGSMSKSHAMTGSRCGWIIGPEEVITRLTDLSTVTTYGVPGFIQDASAYALSLGPAFEAEIAAPFKRRRALVQNILPDHGPVRLLPCEGAMYAMLDIRATGLSGEDFAMRLLEDTQIAVMPGESFGRAAAGHLRVALTVEDHMLEDALKRLLRFAHDVAG